MIINNLEFWTKSFEPINVTALGVGGEFWNLLAFHVGRLMTVSKVISLEQCSEEFSRSAEATMAGGLAEKGNLA